MNEAGLAIGFLWQSNVRPRRWGKGEGWRVQQRGQGQHLTRVALLSPAGHFS